MKTCPECKSILPTQSNKFCNSSCAAKFNNKKYPKRIPEKACRVCQTPITADKTWCSDACLYTSHPNRDPNATHQTCQVCEETKPVSSFYMNGNHRKNDCKSCANKKRKPQVLSHRRNIKKRLVEYHGGSCVDCGYSGPYFIFEFDHRDPKLKSFAISRTSGAKSRTYEVCLEESLKCDLVCPTCHRWRTHRQRCTGCDFC